MFKKYQLFSNAIYSSIGSGHRECVYQKAFEIHLRKHSVEYESHKIVPVNYLGCSAGFCELDILTHDIDFNQSIIIELKTVTKITRPNIVQVQKYMQELGIDLGLIVNFPIGGGELEFYTIDLSIM